MTDNIKGHQQDKLQKHSQKEITNQEQRFLVSDDKASLQLNVIHGYLTSCYWSRGISRGLVTTAISNSMCFGLYFNDRQIGFARVITDKAAFAYLADVFVLPKYSNRGLGTALIDFIMQHSDLQGLRRFMLCTLDAHELYKKFAFRAIDSPQSMMQINKPGLYLTE
ncbi:GNAT family N-acetyltransferase [Colwellia psychrerythraea]|uniref:GCN5-related N-acetyltransferase n=1 Tax=Colwellia psychrerythraea TaxID=28229 RepID=A0A099KVW2_COLPS|nr:GNAT family N-acetyltransferase [Colwellia psychrerythraea]KGJ94884.1 GCN5-related N-acetyltransferase [Colwellia psychrerythraea]